MGTLIITFSIRCYTIVISLNTDLKHKNHNDLRMSSNTSVIEAIDQQIILEITDITRTKDN